MDRNHRINALIPTFLFLVGVFSLVIGITRGEAFLVLTKAIRVCLECIGIG